MKKANIAILAILTLALPLAAQTTVNCLPTGQALNPLPEQGATNHILKATIVTAADQVRMTSGNYGNPITCQPQWVREYFLNTAPAASQSKLDELQPGPLLRAEVGDLVEITFLNQIDRNLFPNSDTGCDQTSTYPGTKGEFDTYPDCFALSTTSNMHYHGTHTNPNSTGDNVFLEISPSPRSNSSARTPVVTSATVAAPFGDFFTKCETNLNLNNTAQQWPYLWGDLPQSLIDYENGLLQTYAPSLLAQNETAIKAGKWPQYYVGNYPYCFRLPKYSGSTWPPPKAAAHTHDASTTPLLPTVNMGQSPGTHWFHAHKHGSTTVNVRNGMTGIFVIEDNSPTGYDGWIKAQYKAFPNFKQQVLLINQLGVAPALERSGGGGPGPHFSVNGRIQPKIPMQGGEVQLWRFANNSSRAGMALVGPGGSTHLSWKQTAQDGVQLADANYQASVNPTLIIAAGNRADLLVKAPMLPSGSTTATYALQVTNEVDPTQDPPYTASPVVETLLTVQVNANGPNMPFMTTAAPMPPFLTDITDGELNGTQTLKFASTPPGPGPTTPIAAAPAQHTINGVKFNDEVGASARLGTAGEWMVSNASFGPLISHPFHIHINPFQISEFFDPNAYASSAPGAGTVSMTATGGGTVTGTGTNFTTSTKVGNFIWIVGQGPGVVTAIQSDTAITTNLGGAAITNAKYTLAVPLYTIQNPKQPGQCYLDPAKESTWHPCGPTVPATNRVWWDVFPIPSGGVLYAANGTSTTNVPGYFKMRSRFVDYMGYFVLHCHILAHEDRGMMTVVEVSPNVTPYSHHPSTTPTAADQKQ